MSQEPVIGYVHSTESFGSVDGPGIRFVAFMQGCNMRCLFCHNPDTWKMTGGMAYTPRELFNEAIQYRAFWGKKGGVTCSGGEPLLHIDFLIQYFKICKANGVHTTIDTCGQPFDNTNSEWMAKFDELLEYTDLIILDLKQLNPQRHLKLTGFKNNSIINLAYYLKEKNQPIWVRHVLVPTVTDFDEDLQLQSDFIASLDPIVKKVEILPYHTMGVYKYKELGVAYRLKDVEPPTEDRIQNAENILKVGSYQGYQDM